MLTTFTLAFTKAAADTQSKPIISIGRNPILTHVKKVYLRNYIATGNVGAMPSVLFLRSTFGTGTKAHFNISSTANTTNVDAQEGIVPLYAASFGTQNEDRLLAAAERIMFANCRLELYALSGTLLQPFTDYTNLTLEFVLEPCD